MELILSKNMEMMFIFFFQISNLKLLKSSLGLFLDIGITITLLVNLPDENTWITILTLQMISRLTFKMTTLKFGNYRSNIFWPIKKVKYINFNFQVSTICVVILKVKTVNVIFKIVRYFLENLYIFSLILLLLLVFFLPYYSIIIIFFRLLELYFMSFIVHPNFLFYPKSEFFDTIKVISANEIRVPAQFLNLENLIIIYYLFYMSCLNLKNMEKEAIFPWLILYYRWTMQAWECILIRTYWL